MPAESARNVTRAEAHDLYRRFVNPAWVDLLEALDFGRHFVRAEGNRIYDDTQTYYTDFLAGYGVHNLGHNHPRLLQALHQALDQFRPSMLNVDAPLDRAELARQLVTATHADLCRMAFANSGSEAVEIAIKTVRAATGRTMLVSCQGAYHGLSAGALSLMDPGIHRQSVGPLLESVVHIPFNDPAALDSVCRQHKPAGFFVEPLQGEGGIKIPEPAYLREASGICRAHGCLLVVDEIQTGLGRTGRLVATPLAEVVPDLLLLGKALSGGMVPIAVTMMRAPVWKKAYARPDLCNLSTSTFAGGALAVAAARATLTILQEEGLVQRAAQAGDYLLGRLQKLALAHSIIKAVRGRGLLVGLEFAPASGLLMKAVPAWARAGLYTQVISALLLQDHHILTQPCSLQPTVLRIEPPLTITREEIDQLITALDAVLTVCPGPTAALRAAFRKNILGKDL